MRGVYEIVFKAAAVAGAKTLLLVTAPAGKVLELLSAEVSNSSSLTNQQLEATFQRVNVLGSPAGSAVVPTLLEEGDQAAAGTFLSVLSAEPTSYANNTEIAHQGWPAQGQFMYQPQPEERATVQPGHSIGLRLLAAPSPALDLVVRLKYREIG